MSTFSRTVPGLIATPHFHPKKDVVIYVEGKTDWTFYDEICTRDPFLNRFNCVIKSAGGKPKCMALVNALKVKKRRYVVILDGDYDILPFPPSLGPQVVLLHRHSVENYLFEAKPIEKFCLDRMNGVPGPHFPSLANEFWLFLKNVEANFKDLLVLDIARHNEAPHLRSFLREPDRFFATKGKIDFHADRIDHWSCTAAVHVSVGGIATAEVLVNGFLKKHRFIDLLPGHFAFGIVRRFIIHMLRRGGVTGNIQDRSIRASLSRLTWGFVTTSIDHTNLNDSLCAAVRHV